MKGGMVGPTVRAAAQEDSVPREDTVGARGGLVEAPGDLVGVLEGSVGALGDEAGV